MNRDDCDPGHMALSRAPDLTPPPPPPSPSPPTPGGSECVLGLDAHMDTAKCTDPFLYVLPGHEADAGTLFFVTVSSTGH